jgi:ADP-ribosylglycohydrolase
MEQDRGQISRRRGCLLGGALGDMIGAPVEFLKREEIDDVWSDGVRPLPAYGKLGAITDDTQMTLFAAEGLIRGKLEGGGRMPSVYAFGRWLTTQGENAPSLPESERESGLLECRELYVRRAPGNTCLTALRKLKPGEDQAVNDSKGCGAVMRSAPYGVFRYWELAGIGAQVTHGNPVSTYSSMAFAKVIEDLIQGAALNRVWPPIQDDGDMGQGGLVVDSLLSRAFALAEFDAKPEEAYAELGEGWIAEECLALGLWAALAAKGDFKRGIELAARHSGDSDSVAAVCGSILGAHLGEEALPADWLEVLELRGLIGAIAEDLYIARSISSKTRMKLKWSGCAGTTAARASIRRFVEVRAGAFWGAGPS